MEIFMVTNGDSDTGISDMETTITTNIDIEQYDEEERKLLREKAKEFGNYLHGEVINEVWLEDECADCQHRMKRNDKKVFVCNTDGCPNNPKTYEKYERERTTDCEGH